MMNFLTKARLVGLGLVVGLALTTGSSLAGQNNCATGNAKCCAKACGGNQQACLACCRTANHMQKRECPQHCQQGHCGFAKGARGR